MNIQWYPGHMLKTKRLIKENLKLVDLVIEILDARIPISSRNPDIDSILNNKPRLIVLNKRDLADPVVNERWKDWFEQKGFKTVLINCQNGEGINKVTSLINKVLEDKINKRKSKGMINRSIKLMILGIPNVGKSSFINRFAGKTKTKTGNKPGITKGKQWIKMKQGFELLDTPGILWPKFEDENIGIKLAISGAIKDEIINDIEYLACLLLDILKKNYPDNLEERFKIKVLENMSGYDILKQIGRKRGCVLSGNEIDIFRISNILLDEFRNGKIGRISLEKPEEF